MFPDDRGGIEVVDSDQFAMSGIPNWQDATAAEKALSTIPLYAAIKANDPAAYQAFATQFAEAIKMGSTQLELQTQIRNVLETQLLPKYLKTAQRRID